MALEWKKSPVTGDWADYNKEALQPFEDDKEEKCVYLIWSESERKMIYVGSGNVDRLWDHLTPSDPAYEAIHDHSNLKATYALIDEKYMLGAENYLAQVYTPLATERSPKEPFVEVNMPTIDVHYHSDRLGGISDSARAMRSSIDCVNDKIENH